MKTGLVLEGGAFRTIFSCGVCDAFLDAGLPLPDYTVGVSAGIAYGVSYLSRQSRRNLKLLTTYANDKRYMGVGNFLDRRNRSYFGLKFSYETIPNELLPFDYETFAAYPGTVEAVVTNLNTGRAEYLEVPRRDEHFLLLQATCAIPLMFPVIHLDGQPYLDGGCADAIPWRHALEAGCDRVVVVLTREPRPAAAPGPVFPPLSPVCGDHGSPGGVLQPEPPGPLRHGGLRQGADPGAGEHRRLFPHGAGRGQDPRPVAVRLFRGPPGAGRCARLLDGDMMCAPRGLSGSGGRGTPASGRRLFPHFTDT